MVLAAREGLGKGEWCCARVMVSVHFCKTCLSGVDLQVQGISFFAHGYAYIHGYRQITS